MTPMKYTAIPAEIRIFLPMAEDDPRSMPMLKRTAPAVTTTSGERQRHVARKHGDLTVCLVWSRSAGEMVIERS